MPKFRIQQGDCVDLMARSKVKYPLIIADPPFNFDMDYGEGCDDKRPIEDYHEWTRQWTEVAEWSLTPTGMLCVFAPDEHAGFISCRLGELGLHLRNWIVWHYTFGVNCQKKFGRSHTHILCYSKHRTKFHFDKAAVAVPSARQTEYGDKRAEAGGRSPHDVWVLRPQDSAEHYSPADDTWHVPRVAGTFKERTKVHACQMPVEVAARLVAAYSKPGDTVLDPMCGIATSGAAALGLGRNFEGIELNPEYVAAGRERLAAIKPKPKPKAGKK